MKGFLGFFCPSQSGIEFQSGLVKFALDCSQGRVSGRGLNGPMTPVRGRDSRRGLCGLSSNSSRCLVSKKRSRETGTNSTPQVAVHVFSIFAVLQQERIFHSIQPACDSSRGRASSRGLNRQETRVRDLTNTAVAIH